MQDLFITNIQGEVLWKKSSDKILEQYLGKSLFFNKVAGSIKEIIRTYFSKIFMIFRGTASVN